MIEVRWIDVVPWKRWRHARLRLIWETIANVYADRWLHFRPYRNAGRESHADVLQSLFDKVWARNPGDPQYTIIVESDWLPSLPHWVDDMVEDLGDHHILAPGRQRTNVGDTAPYCMLLDNMRLDEDEILLRSYHPRDPAADLHRQAKVKHYLALEPEHAFGPWRYPYGWHLMWQRHYHDPVDMRIPHGTVGEMVIHHDEAVKSWLRSQPAAFLDAYRKAGGQV